MKLMIKNEINERLISLKPTQLEIVDDSSAHIGHAGAAESGGGHFNLLIVSDIFENKNALERHRLVYSKLADLIPNQIHALSLRAYTPDEMLQI